MRKAFLLPVFLLFALTQSFSQAYLSSLSGSQQLQLAPQQQALPVLTESSPDHVRLSFRMPLFTMEDLSVNREDVKMISMPGSFLPNDEGAPDLPSSSRYIAIPQGANPQLHVNYTVVEVMQGVELAPAPRIPKTTENGPLHYEKNPAIWNNDAFYPSQPVMLGEATQIRGLDVVMLGITPFQYNPVTKELRIYRDIEVEVTFGTSGGQVGIDRLRSRFWDPILKDAVLNADILQPINYTEKLQSTINTKHNSKLKTQNSKLPASGGRSIGCEYLIIIPDDPDFAAWADTLRIFRNKQGIMTDVITTTEIGGNTVAAIETFVNEAYNTWDIVPAAILLLGDYSTGSNGIIAPIWDDYCASDNIYADVNNNDMPDIVFSRILAQNATHLEIMINKVISYETNPPTDPEYYNHPITALGWQTERWFQICIEVVGGFFRNELGKDPVRINEVYEGNPLIDPWSSAPNTGTVMNYFGPNGLNYIPSTPGELGNWSGGNPSMITGAINDGSFLLLHRDHGFELGWGEPSYSNSDMSGLDNDDLTFVYSVNCLTGKYNWGGECFAEAFHRYPKRALGLIAASEVSYSFVNDTYVWGAFDNMWPEFMPTYGSSPEPRGLYPSFSNAAGKYFLESSGWPYNTGNKEVTYNLFHHLGDAFNELYSEVPIDLVVVHDGVILGGASTYTVMADTLSWIAISVDGEIIGVAEGTGSPVDIAVAPQMPGTTLSLVVTKTNHFRFESDVMVIPPNEPYVIYDAHEINDINGNNNGMADYTEEVMLTFAVQNIGVVDAQGVTVTLSTGDPYVTMIDDTEFYGNISGNQSLSLEDAFSFSVTDSIPDMHVVTFDVEATDGDSTWYSYFVVTGHAPVLEYVSFEIDDAGGNANGRIDAGETADIIVTIRNNGSSEAFNVITSLEVSSSYLTLLTGPQAAGDLAPGAVYISAFTVAADENTPGGYPGTLDVDINADFNISGSGQIETIIGQYTALVLDLDPNQNSAPVIFETFGDMDMYADYTTSFPQDLNDYKTIFLSLGIYFSFHELTDAEAQLLADFLENGGKLYMEGRPTWYDDPQTVLHPMFNVNPVYTNWFVYDTIYGQPGTFTEGMKLGFDGVNNYNKYYLEPIEPAYEVLTSLPEERGCMVAYDDGTYRTIACSMDFGSLVDGEDPSTKEKLMAGILGFFGEILTDVDQPQLTVSGTVSARPNPFTDNVTFRIVMEQTSMAKLEVFRITGQKIATVFDGMLLKGIQQIEWNSPTPGGGLYFYRLTTENGSFTGKLVGK